VAAVALDLVSTPSTSARRACIGWLAAAALAVNLPLLHAADAARATGQQLAHDVYKGNCLGCHQIPGDSTAVSLANIGPPLTHMHERFPDRAVLRNQIWDSTARNPETVMPPFGKHGVLTGEEIDLIVDYLYRY
jgi:sulfur-oxidizing protein SoxX